MTKKARIGIYVLGISMVCFSRIGYADELSEVKAQMQRLQEQVEIMRQKIASLEEPQQKAVAPPIEERAARLGEMMPGKTANWTDKIRVYGSLWEYYVSQDSSYFGRTSSYALESIAKIGVEARMSEKLSLNILLSAQNAAGDAGDFTGVATDDWAVEPELAYFVYKDILDVPFSLTLGRQNLKFGDGFLICDGFSDPRAVWTAPVTSFYAVKGTYEKGPVQLDGFVAMPDQDYKSYETYVTDATARSGRRMLYGTNVHFEKEKYGIWDAGIFFKKDDSELQSDTLAMSQRVSYPFEYWPDSKMLPQLTLEGEIVEEAGRTKVKDLALTDSRNDRVAVGGHADMKLTFTKLHFSPFLRESYVYLPGDDPDTDKNEAFDPLFYGFHCPGKWLIGDINSWNLNNSNQRAIMSEIGFSPTKNTLLRGQYFYVTLDRQVTADAGKKWSHEFNLIFDYTPREWFFSGAEFGYAHPLKAARIHAGDDQDTTEVIIWAGVNF